MVNSMSGMELLVGPLNALMVYLLCSRRSRSLAFEKSDNCSSTMEDFVFDGTVIVWLCNR